MVAAWDLTALLTQIRSHRAFKFIDNSQLSINSLSQHVEYIVDTDITKAWCLSYFQFLDIAIGVHHSRE